MKKIRTLVICGIVTAMIFTCGLVIGANTPFPLNPIYPQLDKGLMNKLIIDFTEGSERAWIECNTGYMAGPDFTPVGFVSLEFVPNPSAVHQYDFNVFITSLGGMDVVINKVRAAAAAAIGATP